MLVVASYTVLHLQRLDLIVFSFSSETAVSQPCVLVKLPCCKVCVSVSKSFQHLFVDGDHCRFILLVSLLLFRSACVYLFNQLPGNASMFIEKGAAFRARSELPATPR